MFRIMTGMSKDEWHAQGLSADERGIPHATPVLDRSDDSGEGSDEAAAAPCDPRQTRVGSSCTQKWQASLAERDRVRSSGKWPDGAPVGRGHGQPYIKLAYAEAIASGAKTVEGRPNEGVRRQPAPAR